MPWLDKLKIFIYLCLLLPQTSLLRRIDGSVCEQRFLLRHCWAGTQNQWIGITGSLDFLPPSWHEKYLASVNVCCQSPQLEEDLFSRLTGAAAAAADSHRPGLDAAQLAPPLTVWPSTGPRWLLSCTVYFKMLSTKWIFRQTWACRLSHNDTNKCPFVMSSRDIFTLGCYLRASASINMSVSAEGFNTITPPARGAHLTTAWCL